MPTTTATTWLRVPQAAELANVSIRTIRKWIATGRVRATKPAKLLLVDRDDLLAYLEKCQVPQPAA